jgi:hypothetical protein
MKVISPTKIPSVNIRRRTMFGEIPGSTEPAANPDSHRRSRTLSDGLPVGDRLLCNGDAFFH